MEEAVTPLASFLGNIGTVLTSAVDWMGTIVGTVMTTPVLLVPTALGLAFVGVRLFKSLR